MCGNNVVEPGESCDDGNVIPYDGCSPTCQTEPRCGTYNTSGTPTSAVGACKSVCGDGILIPGAGEQCDDGNTTDGDGCSHDCKQEAGYTCVSSYDSPPPNLSIPIIVRDFQGYRSDGPVDTLTSVTTAVTNRRASLRRCSTPIASQFTRERMRRRLP